MLGKWCSRHGMTRGIRLMRDAEKAAEARKLVASRSVHIAVTFARNGISAAAHSLRRRATTDVNCPGEARCLGPLVTDALPR